jgi:hypothetical protein
VESCQLAGYGFWMVEIEPISALSRVGSHEATILALRQKVGAVEVELEGATYDGEPRSIILTFEGAADYTADDERVGGLFMEAEDGEVLTLDASDDGVRLLVEWNDFEAHKQFTRCYQFRANSVLVEFGAKD